MIPRVIRDWLAEYKGLSKEELHSYAASIRHNGELVSSLHVLIDEHPPSEVLEPICHQLFEFYRSSEQELQRFTLELVPPLVWLYLSFISKGEKSKCAGVEAFLLSLYNLETCTVDGSPKVKTFRIPSFSKHSIYHEPQTLSSGPLLESTLSRLNTDTEVFQDGPHPQYDSINAHNRHTLLAYLLQCYYADIANLSTRSHRNLCKMCSRIVTTGFSTLMPDEETDDEDIIHSSTGLYDSLNRSNQSGELLPRISVSPALLIDMLSCLYFIIYASILHCQPRYEPMPDCQPAQSTFNGQTRPGAQAVVDIHYRACYELYPDVLLVTNAIRNSLRVNPSGQPDDGPIGLSLALSPASSSYALSKKAITNASFRATKLPDDIPVQPDDTPNKLGTIDEEESSGKSKGWKGKLAKKDKGDKARGKESRNNSDAGIRSSHTNGDTPTDSVAVMAVTRGQQRTVVDNIELTSLSNNHSNLSKDTPDSLNSSAYSGKHNSQAGKMGGSGSGGGSIKTSVSNKDIKNTKFASSGHSRNPSGGSGGSETYSTDL